MEASGVPLVRAFRTLAEGEAVTQQTSLATGIILVHVTVADVVMLRNTRGTFNSSNTIDSDVDADTYTPDEAGNFAASVNSPFGTFAGGTFFAAAASVFIPPTRNQRKPLIQCGSFIKG